MKFGFEVKAIAVLFVAQSMAGTLQAETLSPGRQPTSSFIVSCDCATPAKQSRVRRGIERAGGKIIYAYKQINGFAVTARRPGDAGRLERKLRGIAGVQSVQPDSVVHLNPPGQPQ